MVWDYNGPDGAIEVSQDRTGQAQYLNGTPEQVARYAVWWRKQVNPAQDLLFYNDGFDVVVPLTRDTTEETILKALNGN
jgi:hypothetical protein